MLSLSLSFNISERLDNGPLVWSDISVERPSPVGRIVVELRIRGVYISVTQLEVVGSGEVPLVWGLGGKALKGRHDVVMKQFCLATR